MNHIKNDSRIFEHPQDCSFSDSERGFGKETCTHILFHTPRHLSKGKIDIIMMAEADKKFSNKIITGGETWCFAYDPETKLQSSECW